jgi:hypothetical protein
LKAIKEVSAANEEDNESVYTPGSPTGSNTTLKPGMNIKRNYTEAF